jgi:hypothetical protein
MVFDHLQLGQQIVDTCRSIAQKQFESDPAGAAQCEIELLRTKVLELTKKLLPPGDTQRAEGAAS